METQEIKKNMTNIEKYERIGRLIDNPTHHEIARTFFAASIPGGPVSLIEDGIQIEDHARYYAAAGGTDMPITADYVEDVHMTVVEFCELLMELVDAGGMEGFWPGKIRILFHLQNWTDIPIK